MISGKKKRKQIVAIYIYIYLYFTGLDAAYYSCVIWHLCEVRFDLSEIKQGKGKEVNPPTLLLWVSVVLLENLHMHTAFGLKWCNCDGIYSYLFCLLPLLKKKRKKERFLFFCVGKKIWRYEVILVSLLNRSDGENKDSY